MSALISPIPSIGQLAAKVLGYIAAPAAAAAASSVAGGSGSGYTIYWAITLLDSSTSQESLPSPVGGPLVVAASHHAQIASPVAPDSSIDKYLVYAGTSPSLSSMYLQNSGGTNIGTAFTTADALVGSGNNPPKKSGFYKGLTISGGAIDQLFNTGSLPDDLALSQFALRKAILGNGSGGFGSGVLFDASVDQAISDYIAANNS